MEKLPLMAVDLVLELDKTYPHRCADPSEPERMIWIRAGQRILIDSLLSRLEESEDDVLSTKLLEDK